MKRSHAKKATREMLLGVAETAFIESDFRASTFEIARTAGVAHGTLFFHFKTRDELVLAIVRRLVLRMTDSLFIAYKDSDTIETFLSMHFETTRSNWPLLKALLSGFAEFSDEVKQEIVSLLAVVNFYLVEAFNAWSDSGLVRAILWQGALVYLSFFGDYMLDKKRISEKFIRQLIAFMQSPRNGDKSSRAKIAKTQMGKKLCISCGMLLYNPEDYPMADTKKNYCKYCARPDGTLRSFDEVLDIVTTFFQKTQVLNPEAAHQTAFAVLSKNPAWKEYIKKYY